MQNLESKLETRRERSPWPWTFVGITSLGCGRGYYTVVDSDDKCVCDLRNRPVSDAHLISAAPDMYEALKAILIAAETTDFSKRSPQTCETARAALAKADGRDNG